MSINTPENLDRTDLRILDTVQRDGRITNRELAETVSLSPSACHQRLQRLIEKGWINSFHGDINVDRLCSPMQCIAAISMATHSPDSFRQLEARVDHMPEVLEAYTVSGASDFIIRFACPSMTRYIELTDELIRECPAISNISTHVVMRQSKRFSGFPLRALNPNFSF
ncbi:Lrp/AsnC family transcriptional regulator [Oceanicoccus sp. KOV_DT_Chl]|uniref:Lrp/AsnC family transcriptional regulator n=1 Tax=Oceanicoccus sp. KOV_DT_Chl TaxID=1904639 RepID=UPI000C7C46EC|nr:Lrp/AsnC family transcriptional regulator [Oceanicoccus sp. KOV_DT_Chl]